MFQNEWTPDVYKRQVLEYLNEGYEWVIDIDIEKYFDTVHHDNLISILRDCLLYTSTMKKISVV